MLMAVHAADQVLTACGLVQGHGTPKESKSPPDGRASGTVRRSVDGGKTWEASVVLNGHNAYSYSCLSKVCPYAADLECPNLNGRTPTEHSSIFLSSNLLQLRLVTDQPSPCSVY